MITRASTKYGITLTKGIIAVQRHQEKKDLKTYVMAKSLSDDATLKTGNNLMLRIE